MAKILIVEDDPDIRMLLELRLSRSGHRTLGASSCAEALRLLDERGSPEVLVSDVSLPDGSGFELVSGLHARAEHVGLPVIFLSGHVQPADVAAGRALGATYLTKPLVISALRTAIDQALDAAAETGGR